MEDSCQIEKQKPTNEVPALLGLQSRRCHQENRQIGDAFYYHQRVKENNSTLQEAESDGGRVI